MPQNTLTTPPAPPTPKDGEIEAERGALSAGSRQAAQTLAVRAAASAAVPGGRFRDWDPLALASAACGLTALIPVTSQVLGLVLGLASLVRIRSARRRGLVRRGTGWAWAGIISSGLMLFVWLLILTVILAVGGTFVGAAGALPTGG